MTQQPVEAEVVLTSDNSQYDAAMQSSAAQTDQLGKSVDTLGSKLDRLAKSAGRKMMVFGAGDLAGITAATLAYGAFEKQMESLHVQAAALTQTVGDQKKVFAGYTADVNNLRSSFGLTTRDAAALEQTLSKLTDRTTSLTQLGNSYGRLSKATGESASALADSMIQFQKIMGQPQRETNTLSDQLVTLTSTSNASAQSILDFASTLAPATRQIGISATDTMGLANGLMKAGADGYRASNVITSMVNDISLATQTGSPDLHKYANLMGMTVDQFQRLGGTQQVTGFFDAVNRQGPRAIATLNQMGYDGVNAFRTISSVAQSGDLSGEVNAARQANTGTTAKAAQAATEGLYNSMGRLRTTMQQTAESFGANFAPMATKFVNAVDTMAGAILKIVNSPVGKIAAMVAGAAAGFGLLAGSILLAGKALTGFAATNLLFRNSFTAGFRDAAKGYSPAQRAALLESDTQAGLVGGKQSLGPRGDRMVASGRANWVNDRLYGAGAATGLRAPAMLYGEPGGTSVWRRMMDQGIGGAARLAGLGTRVFGDQLTPLTVGIPKGINTDGVLRQPSTWFRYFGGTGGLDNPAQRWQLFRSPTFTGSVQNGAAAVERATGQSVGWLRQGALAAYNKMYSAAPGVEDVRTPAVQASAPLTRTQGVQAAQAIANPGLASGAVTSTGVMGAAVSATPPKPGVFGYATPLPISTPHSSYSVGAAGEDVNAAAGRAAKVSSELGVAQKTWSESLKSGAVSLRNFEGATGAARSGLASLVRSIGYSGTMAGAAGLGVAKTAGSWLMGGVSSIAGNPVSLAMMGFTAYELLKNKTQPALTDYSGMVNPYLQSSGAAPIAPRSGGGNMAPATATNMRQALRIGQPEQFYARSAGYKPTSSMFSKSYSFNDAMKYLPGTWQAIKNNPQAVQNLAMDLTNAYGQSQAQQILNKMSGAGSSTTGVDAGLGDLLAQNLPHSDMGTGPAPVTLDLTNQLTKSFEVGRQHWGLTGEDENKVGQPFDKAFSAIKDQSAIALQYGGTSAGAGVAAADTNSLLRSMYYGWQNANPNGGVSTTGLKGSAEDTSTAAGTTKYRAPGVSSVASGARLDAIAKEFAQNGFGTDFSSDDAKKILTAMVGAKTGKDATLEALKAYFGDTGVSDANRIQFLSDKTGITYDKASGMDASQMANAVFAQGFSFTPKNARVLQPGTVAYQINQMPGVDGLYKGVAQSGALDYTGNANLQMQQAEGFVNNLQDAGKTAGAINKILGNMKSKAGVESDTNYQFADLAQQYNTRDFGFRLADMNRTQAFGAQMNFFQQGMAIKPGDPVQAKAQDQLVQQTFSTVQDDKQYFEGLLYQQRQFKWQQQRAQDDFNQQRRWQEQDYNLQRGYETHDFYQQQGWQQQDFNIQRARAEQEYQIQRAHAERDFNLQQTRAQDDFNLQRQRQAEDYHHQIDLMAQSEAKSYADIYQRTPVQRTEDATWTLTNAQEQLQAMKQQEQQLSGLRKQGLSDTAIQQLKLNDPQNAQQLSRFYDDVANNPELIKQFNQNVSARVKAGAKLVTDSSSSDWQEFQRQYKLSRDRAQTDFQTSVRRAKHDFGVSMSDMAHEFQRQMEQGQQDFNRMQGRALTQFNTQLDRQQTAFDTATAHQQTSYNKSMDRAAQDLNRAAMTIDGSFNKILNDALTNLSGHGQKMAQNIKDQVDGLGSQILPGMTGLASAMSAVFGIKYTAPKLPPTPHSHAGRNDPTGELGTGHATGGVLPGWSPGVDNTVFHGPGGQKLKLAGGESVMVPEWTRAMGGEKAIEHQNRLAKAGLLPHQAFAAGGVYRPVGVGGLSQGIHDVGAMGSAGGPNSAIDFGVPIGTPVHAVASGRVSVSTDLLGDEPRMAGIQKYYSYGRYIEIDHGMWNSLYAHLSQRFAALNQLVKGGETIGLSGNTGHVDPVPTASNPSAGAHLHFATQNANPMNFLNASTNYSGAGTAGPPIGGGYSGTTVGGSAHQSIKSILSDTYPWAEKAARSVTAWGGFKEPGTLSGVINKLARQYWQKLVKQHPNAFNPFFGGGGGGNIPNAPDNVSGNVAIGKAMAAAYGWGSGNEWDALYKLWTNESGWRTTIKNPTSPAYGIPQADPGSKMASAGSDWATNPRTQIKWGLDYIKHNSNFNDPISALTWWNRTDPRPYPGHWYGSGGIFQGAQNIGVGEHGPEMVLPLNGVGANFLQSVMDRVNVGNSGKEINTAHHCTPMAQNMYNTYHIDKSTTFSGDITVTANDPNQFVHQMRQRSRTRALSQPAIGGSR